MIMAESKIRDSGLSGSTVRVMKDEEAAHAPEPEWRPTIHELAIMLTMSVTSLMIALDATIVVTTIETIVTDLNGSATEGFWIGTSYLLTCAVCMPFIASLSDIFGRPICLLASLAIFAIGTLICCLARGIATLIGGRCVQGIGGGGLIILGLVIFTDIVPLRFRSKYYGIIQGAWAIGTCIGPLVGGAFVEHTTWRWIFYIMFPFIGIAFATIPFVLTLKPRTESFGTKLARVDWIGGFLFISSSTSLLIAISWGGTQEPWSSWRTIVPLVLGAFGLVATGLFETYLAKEPIFGRNIFHCRDSFAAYAGATLQGFLLYGILYYGELYFLAVKGYGPVHAGSAALPTTLSLVPGSVVVGILITKFGSFRWAIWSGWALSTLANGLLVLWDVDTHVSVCTVILILIGIGHGLVLNAQNFATQAIALTGDEAQAAAMYAFLRSFGMALGVGIGGSVFQNVMMIKLNSFGLPNSIARYAEAYIRILWSSPPTEQTDQILQAYAYGLRGTYGLFCAIAGTAGIASIFIQKFDLNKELRTEHTLGENRITRKLEDVSRPVSYFSTSRAESCNASKLHVDVEVNSRPSSTDERTVGAMSRPVSDVRASYLTVPGMRT
ncbi:uncharacterized protein PV09_02531 [Verruconis gallopava]|uniref:Major facilitator superfamily (MFS) profile domain-containing protein n=1 Tax=Verruconis gallopava TaxID=253628 RepID=A0A0D2AJV9_9PEZI|nr:uncharacterized protein PV09_02531 [Verruconis gallopava]KIW06855.1 hypothetical protein PV09_02531 [Verruconis gallopava]